MSEVDCQPINKVVKFGYLLQSVKGGCQELIGIIPNNEEGLQLLPILKKLLIYWQSKE